MQAKELRALNPDNIGIIAFFTSAASLLPTQMLLSEGYFYSHSSSLQLLLDANILCLGLLMELPL